MFHDHDWFFTPQFLIELVVCESTLLWCGINWLETILASHNEPAVSDVSKLKRYNSWCTTPLQSKKQTSIVLTFWHPCIRGWVNLEISIACPAIHSQDYVEHPQTSSSIITLFNPIILFNMLQNIRVNLHSPVQLSISWVLKHYLCINFLHL